MSGEKGEKKREREREMGRKAGAIKQERTDRSKSADCVVYHPKCPKIYVYDMRDLFETTI